MREQEQEARHVCEREGWHVAHVITDSVGASRHSKGTRHGWAEAVGILESGTVDVLVTWEASRAQRDLDAYTALRNICARHNVLWSYSGRLYDLSDSGDRFTTGLDALLAEKEADQISDRVRRAVRANAAAGRPHGRILYGYRRLYDPGTGRLDRQEPDPDTAPIVRRIFTESLEGRGIDSIARRLNDDGIPTAQGRAWTYRTISRVLHNPGYAGRRTHKGEVIGTADWPAIIDPVTFDKTQAHLAARRGPRAPNTTRLLTSVARCGVCQSRQVGVIGGPSQRRIYVCRENRCVGRDATKLDLYVTRLVLARIEQIDTASPEPQPDSELAALHAEITAHEARWDELADMAAAGKLSVKMLARQEQTINAELARLRDQVRRMSVPRHLEPPTGDVGEWWEALPLATRRDWVNALVDVLVIHKTRRGERTLNRDAVEVVWR